jgi:hypothetical protein
MAELGLTANHSAASRRDAPDAMASTTRSRNSKEHGFGIDPPPKIESVPPDSLIQTIPGNTDSTQVKSALRDTILRWVESEKLPSERGVFAPDATPAVSPEKPPKKEASKTLKKQDKSARKLQRPQIVASPPKKPPITDSPETAMPEETEGQSAPPASMRLRTPFPAGPPPGVFSR